MFFFLDFVWFSCSFISHIRSEKDCMYCDVSPGLLLYISIILTKRFIAIFLLIVSEYFAIFFVVRTERITFYFCKGYIKLGFKNRLSFGLIGMQLRSIQIPSHSFSVCTVDSILLVSLCRLY